MGQCFSFGLDVSKASENFFFSEVNFWWVELDLKMCQKKRKMAKNLILRSDLDETTSFNSYGQRIRSSELQNCHCRYVVIAQIVRKTMGSQCNGGKW